MERFSKYRQAILECLQATTCHPTADQIYTQLLPVYPNISLGTVYRNLCQLKEAGMIRSMGVVAGEEHFDGNVTPHSHLVCRVCGKIDDLTLTDSLVAITNTIESQSDFTDTVPSFIGICPGCSAGGQ